MKNTGLPGTLLLALVLVCGAVVLWGWRMALSRTSLAIKQQRSRFALTALIMAGWLALLAALSLNGFFHDLSRVPPRPALVIVVPAIFLAVLSFRQKTMAVLAVTPPHWLVMAQSFRIAVEIILWMAFKDGLLPEQMTFSGLNFDMLSGVLGFVAGWMMLRSPRHWQAIAVVYNIIGLLLLLNILVIAVLSIPGPLRYFMNEPANTVVADLPFIYLPGALVVLAIGLHIFSLRQAFMHPRVNPYTVSG